MDMNTVMLVLGAWMLVIALGIDAFACSFGYGVNKVKIPLKSILMINLICSALLAVGLFFGSAIETFLSETAADWISFAILFSLGIYKLFDHTIKKIIQRHNGVDKEIRFSLFRLGFLLKIYANPTTADVDNSKVLSPRESIPLAIAIGLDGLSVGFGVGVSTTTSHAVLLVGLSLVSDILALMLGCFLGNKIAKKMSLDLSWLSGVILIAIALFGIIS